MTTTWRDIADQLSADQIDRLEGDEADGDIDAASLLFMARDLVCVRLNALFQL